MTKSPAEAIPSTATKHLAPCKSGPPGMVATEYMSHNKFLRVSRRGSRWIAWWRHSATRDWILLETSAGTLPEPYTYMSPVLAMDAARDARSRNRRESSRNAQHRI